MNLDLHFPPRQKLAFLPTPLHEMRRLREAVGGPALFIKRDDLTGLALGGNKTRKLEYLIGDALSQGCDTVITSGAAQSNHCRQTAAAAAACGMSCHLSLGGNAPDTPRGNLLLNHLLGAGIHHAGNSRKGEQVPELATNLEAAGHRPYTIPYGGSNAIGALGYVAAVLELHSQLRESGIAPTHVVFASSSGGMHAGLRAGAAILGANYEIIGIAIDKEQGPDGLSLGQRIDKVTGEVLDLLLPETTERPETPPTILNDSYLGEGYGVVADPERDAIKTLAANEGILLDPVYTGRAFAGLLDMIRSGQFKKDDHILFWHTGGAPALFATDFA